jgi:DNA-binding protein Fis
MYICNKFKTNNMNQEEKQESKPMTQEELTAQRKNVIKHYTNQIEVLKIQSQYEQLLAEIEMHRAKRMEMIIRQAQMAAGPQQEEPETDPESEQEEPLQEAPKERKLKKS